MADAADGFCGRPSVEFRGPLIPIADASIHPAHDDGVITQVQQSRLLGNLFSGLLAFGDVGVGAEPSGDPAVLTLDWQRP